jgi:glycosyltransferase involved in cell wall biosynthesis
MKKKVSIVGTAGLPAAYGGFETLAQNLVSNLGKDYDFTVFCKRTPPAKRLANYLSSKLVYLPLHSNGWESLPYDVVSLLHAMATSEVVLYLGPVAGLVMPANWIFRKKVIVNFGGLNEWEREKLHPLEKIYMQFSCLLCAKLATRVIADNHVLRKSIKKAFGVESTVIRYGGDHAVVQTNSSELATKYPFANTEYYVSVARAQVDNNIHVLIDAFKEVPDKKLVLISNWQVSKYGCEMYEKARNVPNIVALPAIYNSTEIDYIRARASGYIHSHSCCGTAPSLVEAICLGLPVISWDVPTNHETTKEKALYFDSKERLVEIIRRISQDDLNELRNEMASLINEEYSWGHISKQYAEIFE